MLSSINSAKNSCSTASNNASKFSTAKATCSPLGSVTVCSVSSTRSVFFYSHLTARYVRSIAQKKTERQLQETRHTRRYLVVCLPEQEQPLALRVSLVRE